MAVRLCEFLPAGLWPALSLVLALTAAIPAPPARAADDSTKDPDSLALGAGIFDVRRRHDLPLKNDAGLFDLEYRSDKQLWWFKPMIGAFGTTEGAFYTYAGIRLDVYFGDRLVFTPSFAPGLYHQGNGNDLGFEVEFRSSAEIAWRFDDFSRLSFGVSHISNASLGRKNPGVENLTVMYSIPFRKLIGGD